jgi:glyoxalase family protein
VIEIQELPQEQRGAWGIGTVHHVAWRMKDSEEEMAMRGILESAGHAPTGQIDRFWFKSVYFREPGEVLFELATDGPGFDRDEPMENLGEQLILPPWLEQYREKIETALPRLEMPKTGA